MRALVLAALIALPLPALAQDDRDRLTAFLEDSLSDAGRTVTVTGFRGALSSRATVDSLTIADDAGVWLTLNGVELDWNRAAVLAGRISINALVAQEVIVDRPPQSVADAPPAPEAGGFALPELPVSVEIGRIAAERVVLGETVLGQPVEGRLDAGLTLSGGEGRAQLAILRADDGPEGRVDLTASYANASQMLVIDLIATEGPGGIAASLLDLPGRPAAELSIKGSGPLADFAATLRLATDGQNRLAGQVTLRAEADGAQGFAADLSGDLAPLFLPDYAAFFGDAVRLRAEGRRSLSGAVDLSALAVETRALSIAGMMRLAPDGLPLRLDLTGRVGLPDGQPVLLPLGSGPETRVRTADLRLRYDASQGDGWSGEARLTGLQRPDLAVAEAVLRGSGRIARQAAGGSVLGATLTFGATGVAPADPGLAEALGPDVTGVAKLFWQPGGDGLRLASADLQGAGYRASLRGRIEGLSTGFRLSGDLQAAHDDLGRLSGLAGRPLSGGITLDATVAGSPLAGDVDLTARLQGRDLTIGQAQADRLLAGSSAIALSVLRDATGTTLRNLEVTAGLLQLTAEGKIATAGSDLRATVALPDLAALDPAFGGALQGELHLRGPSSDLLVSLSGTAEALRTGQPEADRLLAGRSRLDVALRVTEGAIRVEDARIANPQVTGFASGLLTGPDRRIALQGRLANLALILPEFPGPLTLSAEVGAAPGGGHQLAVALQGPGQIDAQARGTLAAGFDAADLALTGRAQAALANPFLGTRALGGLLSFDLRLAGPLALSALSGRVDLSAGRLSDPALHFALQDLAARVDLSGATARIDAGAAVTSGGRIGVQGTVGLTAPLASDLTVRLEGVTLRDPELYETRADGVLTLQGPLLGGALLAGRIGLGDTELRVPSTTAFGAGDIPEDLRHVNEPAAVRATRARAGLIGPQATAGGGSGTLRLDLRIDAPNRVFVRGRGLDAELGGSVLLQGTTAAVVPSGGLDLIRGRLDILGRRLVLSRAQLRMEGDLIPWLEIAAETESDGITARVEIAGRADAPEVRFTSSPDLPQEEVLARLLFGRGLENISAFQAAQLAGAVATLAGRGGEGIVARLRQGFGLDDFDLVADGDGAAAVRAGKYLSDRLYTEVEIGQDGKSNISLNLDLPRGVTLKGGVDSEGQAGIGIFMERDY
jgi:translocation and assembly module TamB